MTDFEPGFTDQKAGVMQIQFPIQGRMWIPPKKLPYTKLTSATVVDHIIPHRGDPVPFWDRNN